jgi:hypothetical protein
MSFRHLISKYFRTGCIMFDVRRFLYSVPFIIVSLLFSGSLNISAQVTSLDNYTGNWIENGTWVSGTAPGTSNLNDDVQIYGFVSRFSDLGFNNGNLFVYDTQVICGDLTLGNNADLAIGPNAILIDRGNYTSGNQVEVSNGGVMVPVLIKYYLLHTYKFSFQWSFGISIVLFMHDCVLPQ